MTLAVSPLLASYWLLGEVLHSAIALVVKPDTQQLLRNYRDDLKTLKRLDPDNQKEYKVRFLQATDELLIYEKPQLLKKILQDTYLTYYLVLFIAVLLLSLLTAIWLSHKVARSYKVLSASDVKKAEKIQELVYFDEWQAIASKLAHEINNPLTPIEMMVSNLSRTYENTTPKVFEESLNDTKDVVSEEIYKLKNMVSHFSQFSKLPMPVFKSCEIAQYCTTFIRQHQNAWPNVVFTLEIKAQVSNVSVDIDHLLFNQCLINVITNAVQANQESEQLNISLILSLENESDITIEIFNDGMPIDISNTEVIFKMHYSSKSTKENMGLGLAIVRKIVLDHGGNIICRSILEGAAFKISLPIKINK
ncbi:sensor histidine kinase [Pseudoalteromonas denitrificans]|uniref:sensor histidine kinase n=1 Tax=Pseudoalteromonas denitrificans TaxID=43656 RepID=UPI0015A50EEB|nr:HAMP domain-containing sensor histidine kinase [Pseudoalteromonas denitrificans]